MNFGSTSIVPGGNRSTMSAYAGRRCRYSMMSGEDMLGLHEVGDHGLARHAHGRQEDGSDHTGSILAGRTMEHGGSSARRELGDDLADRRADDLDVHPVDARHVGAPVGVHRALEAGRRRSSSDGQVDVPDCRVDQRLGGLAIVGRAQIDDRSKSDVVDQQTDIARGQLLERATAEQDAVPGEPTVDGRQTTEIAKVRRALEPRRSERACRAAVTVAGDVGVHIDRLSFGGAPTSAGGRRPGSSRSIVPSPSRGARARRGSASGGRSRASRMEGSEFSHARRTCSPSICSVCRIELSHSFPVASATIPWN